MRIILPFLFISLIAFLFGILSDLNLFYKTNPCTLVV